MADEVEIALGKRFIERRDVKAIQFKNGYAPDVNHVGHHPGECPGGCERIRWSMQDLRDHVSGKKSLGHYMVSPEGKTKLFAFDLDLTKEGHWIDLASDEIDLEVHECNPREIWADKSHLGRVYLTMQLRCTAESIAMKAKTLMGDDIHVAIAYSGNKGLHVYCFTDSIPASEAREAASLVMRSINEPDGRPSWKLIKGENFWGRTTGKRNNIEVEIFPKQDDLESKDLGNLMRLPLGVNMKTGQRSFFIDCRCPYIELRQMNPLDALEGELPWD